MKLYELTYLMPLNLPEEEVKSLQEKINSFILESQGTLEKIEDITKKKLGGPVKKQATVQAGVLNFYIASEKLADIEKKMKSENQIIRYMILHKKPRKAEVPRRIRKTAPATIEQDAGTTEKNQPVSRPKKVEIKEIEKKLEEILGEEASEQQA